MTDDNLKEQADDTAGAEERSDLCGILTEIISREGPSVLLREGVLSTQMAATGASPGDILRICLLTKTPGFRELLQTGRSTPQADLDRFVWNAVAETGLTRSTVLRLTADLCMAAGIAAPPTMEEIADGSIHSHAYVIPMSLYRKELREFEDGLLKTGVAGADLRPLKQLSSAGVPEARRMLGLYLMHGFLGDKNPDAGLRLLHSAAQEGDADACAALGDYYYRKGGADNWSKAYQYYTGYGAIALTPQRKSAVVEILNHRVRNRRILIACGVFFLFMLMVLFAAPGAGLYGPHPVWGILCLLAEAGIMTLAVLHFRKKPYDFLRPLPVAMLAVWSVYLAIRLLF